MISLEMFEPVVGNAFAHFAKLTDLGAKTNLVDLSMYDDALIAAGEPLGLQLALVKFMALIFLAYPMAVVMKILPGKNLKHLFSFLGGLFMCQWLFGADWIHAALSSVVTYLLCLLIPGKHMPIMVFIWVMGYMTVSHAYRMYVSYHSGVFDYTGTQMVLTMKLTSFAYNVYDGTTDREKVFNTEHSDKRLTRMYNDRRKFAISKLPNPLEFFGYIFCFTCLMAGPAFEYSDYVTVIDGTAFKKDPKDKRPTVPSSFFPGLKVLVVALCCLGLHLKLSEYFSSSQLYQLDWIAATPWYWRVPYFWMTELMERQKYYFVWKAAEGASVMAGFGFEGYDAEGKIKGWGGVDNCDILGVELAPNLQSMVRSWNKRTQGWLERYTYCRLGNSLVATYFVSALWHGLYPGYFMFFLSVPILTSVERLVRVKINPRIIPGYNGRDFETAPNTLLTKLYWVVCMIGTSLGLNYIAQIFAQQVQTGERAMIVWGSYYHIPHLAFVLIYVVLSIIPTPRVDKKSDDAKKKK